MGDGQHVWASAEWVLMVRNCFVHEEDGPERLILCHGITPDWSVGGVEASFGPAPTSFGPIRVAVKFSAVGAEVRWEGRWFDREPVIEIRMPGFVPVTAPGGSRSAVLTLARIG
jgi:hypothetical protein